MINYYEISDSRHERLGKFYVKTLLNQEEILNVLQDLMSIARGGDRASHVDKLMNELKVYDTATVMTKEQAETAVSEMMTKNHRKSEIQDLYSMYEECFTAKHKLFVGMKMLAVLDDKLFSDFRKFHPELTADLEMFKIELTMRHTMS